jgi:hypothetical protein
MNDTNFFSALWKIKMSDWQRGLVIAIISAPLTIIYESLTATPIALTFSWQDILKAAMTAGLAYIMKNFFTGSGGRLLTNAPEKK